jgi:3-deoxy-D-manno-octulosonic-acid transferase
LEGNPTGLLPEAIRRDPHPGFLRYSLHQIYNLIWLVAAILGSPWLLWRSSRRPGFGSMILGRLGKDLPPSPGLGSKSRVVIHGVSVGEVKGAQSILRELERARPDLEVVISTSTETGFAIANALFPDHEIVRFPIDLSFVCGRFLDRVRPVAVILIELEIWPNFLREANRRSIPVAVVNGRITKQSHKSYKVFKGLLPQFNRISLFCSQGPEYTERFLSLFVQPGRVINTGNVKADGLAIGRVDPGDELRRLLGADKEQLTIVAGSTHPPEERLVTQAWQDGLPAARLIVVPRHPKRISEILKGFAEAGSSPQLLSELRMGEVPDPSRPAIVDTIGELERVFGLADIAFVGGSLVPHGGQNMLEPAAQGCPVLTGPHLENFTQEAALLTRALAVRIVANSKELTLAFTELGQNAELRSMMGAAGMEATRAQQGAAALTIRALQVSCLPQIPS